MKKILILAGALILLPHLSLFSQERVEIYAETNPREFGRAPGRDDLLSFSLTEFASVRTLATPDPDGYLTAVLIDPRVVQSLENFLEGYRERRLGNAWYWLYQQSGRKIFHYFDDSLGLRFSFSAEKPGREILSVVDLFYAGDPRTGRLVRRHYLENYVVRIHSAENIIEPWKGRLSFQEAMIAATLIGNREQPLWGIRDGKGLLRDLPEKIAAKTSLPLYHYRAIEKNEEEYLAFIRLVHSMEGSFPRNLHRKAASFFDIKGEEHFLLPEEILPRRTASGTELLLLHCDILVRMGYQVRVLSLGQETNPPSLLLVFREGEKGDWSAMTEREFFPDLSADWTRTPSLVAGRDLPWRELDPLGSFRDRKFVWKN